MRLDDSFIYKNKFLYSFIFIIILLNIFLIKSIYFYDVLFVPKSGNESNLAYKENYNEDLFKFYINNKEVPLKDLKYTIINNIDNTKLGDYQVKYIINYHGKDYEFTKNVSVVDVTAPVIESNEEYIEKYKCQTEINYNINFKVIDDIDGDITESTTKEITDNYLVLTATDKAGNITKKNILIKEVENPSPVIDLIGDNKVYVLKDNKYIEPGFEVKDVCGNKLDKEVLIQNDVDTSKVGEYKIVYSINDETGNLITKIRTVIVYEKEETIEDNSDKVIYLTFDDGPGKYTEQILDILKKYNIKATFFVTNQFSSYVPIIKREADEGHVVAVHSYTHDWSIYNSVDNYLNDFNKMNDVIETYTGKRSKIFRFPGGSSNTISKRRSKGIMTKLTSLMTNEGYVYFDWNVDSGDAAGADETKEYNNFINGIKNRKSSVVLMHDIKTSTLNSLEKCITYALDKGYSFSTLSEVGPIVHHRVNN